MNEAQDHLAAVSEFERLVRDKGAMSKLLNFAHNCKNAAKELDLPHGTVASNVRWAGKRLRKVLSAYATQEGLG